MSVVDASVWISALILQDVHHQSSRQWLDQQLMIGAQLFAPTLALSEIAGAISRRRGSAEFGHEAVSYTVNIPGIRFIELDAELGSLAARVAANLQLRGADAVYVAAAHVLEIPLVTWDQELVARAGSLIDARTPASL